jgi:hypothetical protein
MELKSNWPTSNGVQENMNPTKRTARLAGLLNLLLAVIGGFSLFYIRSYVIVPGDAATSVANIMASESLYRAAIVGSLVSQVLLFFLGLTLFHLFKDVNRRLSMVLLGSVMLTVAIAVINTFNHFGVLLVLSRADFLKAFSQDQINAMALFLLRLANGAGQGLVEIFWAPYYFTFGLLIIRSRFLPKVFGILLMLMGVGFAVNILEKFLMPQFHPLLFTQLAMSLAALGSIPTTLWLLIKGARVSEQQSVVTK